MDTNFAAEHLRVIRTLMERSAVYRRALAPIMIFAGAVGIAAAVLALSLRIEAATVFVAYWTLVALVAVSGSFVLVRRQALKSAEPFWSSPTRRVAQGLAPALIAGLLMGVWVFVFCSQEEAAGASLGAGQLCWLPAAWAIFYGCALNAAGFFTSRGLRLLGWAFIVAGNALLFWIFLVIGTQSPISEALGLKSHCWLTEGLPPWDTGLFPWQRSNWLMGLLFGGSHVAYGIYLYFTEKRRNES